MKTKMRILAATLLAAAMPLAVAQTATTSNAGQANVATKIASNFTNLAGSNENAIASRAEALGRMC